MKKPPMLQQNTNNKRQRARPTHMQKPRPAGGGQQVRPNQWQQNYDRYSQLAQQTTDDAVQREYYWQHAEHFLRMMNGSATKAGPAIGLSSFVPG